MPLFRSAMQPLLSHSIQKPELTGWAYEGYNQPQYSALTDSDQPIADSKRPFNVKMRTRTAFKYCPVDRTGKATQVIEVQEDMTRDGSNNIIAWTFPIGEETFVIELQHGTTWGKRKIYVNDQKVLSKRKLIDDGSNHRLSLTSKDNVTYNIEVSIKEGNLRAGFIYELYINGSPLEDKMMEY